MKDLDYEVYQQLCVGCVRERYCHENCETCEGYNDLFIALAAEEYFLYEHKIERLRAKKIITERLSIGNKHYCPTCKRLIGKYPYCKYCGQAIEV